jgi:hypothetical protein
MFGRGGKNMEKKKGDFKKEKGSGHFLEKKETQGGFGIPSQFGYVQIICKLKHFLSRGQNTISDSHSVVPAQIIRGLLESSHNVGDVTFSPVHLSSLP